MNFSKILPTLQALAPTIATGLVGPVGGLAVQALEQALGIAPGTSQSDDGAALTKAVLGMTPETAAAMRKADQDFDAKMKQLDIDVIALAAKDRDSARNMQVQTKDLTPRLLAAAVCSGLFGLLGLMSFHDMPAANHDAMTLLLGALNQSFGAVIGFYFGSSAGSQAKDATIREAVGKAT